MSEIGWSDSITESRAYSYSPLVISYTDNGAPGWALTIQQTPEPKLLLRGRQPTRGEVAQSLLNIPGIGGIWVLDAFMVLIELAEKENADA